jgi:hypothetical protein
VVDGVELWCSPEQRRVETDHLYWSVVGIAGSMGLMQLKEKSFEPGVSFRIDKAIVF